MEEIILLYDTLLQFKDEARYKKFEGRFFFFTRIGTAFLILGGYFLIYGLITIVSILRHFQEGSA
jgi:hypothetical protein